MRLLIVSNRLPVNIVMENGKYRYEQSAGGLATGLNAYVEKIKKDKNQKIEVSWIGWPGATVENEQKVHKDILKKYGAHCVFLTEEVMEKFYEGFCNKTIWPLFHYFPVYTTYETDCWKQYISVNETFCDAIIKIAKPGDVIWIHDYHLMLLPAMLRKKLPNACIGFFLHIPFPSYEVFRLLPSEWRKEILKGIMGSDLIGFHTHDYCTYFLRSVMRILGNNSHMDEVMYQNRLLKVDTFPMGIDFEKYHGAIKTKAVKTEKKRLQSNNPMVQFILSIDRQDYTKGILKRLEGFEHFLENNEQYRNKVTMMMVVIPSRIGVESYQQMKSKIDELVGRINGKHGTVEWTPIIYQYRSLSFAELIALYESSAVALVTPLRDGMNLIAKEFIAARLPKRGVLILSEMAGAAAELAEAIVINPTNIEEISIALVQALQTGEQEQELRLATMQQRLKNYTVFKWADDFLVTLDKIKKKQNRLNANLLNDYTKKKIVTEFKKAKARTLFLDYDGTLVPTINHPPDAAPGKELLSILEKLAGEPNTDIIVISGRDREPLDRWLGHLPINFIAEHGTRLRTKNKKWQLLKPIRKNWIKKIVPVVEMYAEKLPGSFVEVKEFSVVFHYRKSDFDFADLRVKELINHLVTFTTNMDVQIQQGNFIVELRNAGVEKGVAAMHWLNQPKRKTDFIIAIGDDATDEDLFRVMPENAHTIRVGFSPTYAKHSVAGPNDVLKLLTTLAEL
ncbi:MAG TPA: bifunctional alpha,alpha-trehalose-phosphate synthase (UDP-forming)/trehalose-phosphatase [Bacteroidia bacterium]|nr:bifunctional alpha,alpha-trehalose-phosphate synthase (UDP-forming)/trehalose-phosphatase [Bacteroidia bacterium]HNU32044.1 bifunctional alpha,alpha-trehalose-phosphate synthase (UDP-forming)/trehalose-phosphatase [Bacteroidia bacterium]